MIHTWHRAFYEMSFLRGGVFEKRSALSLKLSQWRQYFQCGHFDQAPLLDVSGYVTWPSHAL